MVDDVTVTEADKAAARAWINRPRGHSDEQADAEEAFAAHRLAARRLALADAAAYLDGYAGGHYMAQSCAQALREMADKQ